MALSVTIPISTEVIENNPDCKIQGQYEKGRVVIRIDTRHQNHHQRLGISTRTQLHWGDEYEYEVQELSGFSWPIRYVVQARWGYYLNGQGQRVHFTTQATGLDSQRKVSLVFGLDPVWWTANLFSRKEAFIMPKSHDPYPPQFRQQRVELVRSGRTPGERSREFEPSAQTLRYGVRQADQDEGRRSDGLTTPEREALRQLRRQVKQLRMEREILAKATAWLTGETETKSGGSSCS